MTQWVYLSPHLDDAVFSCGGLIWEQAQAGIEVKIWTIFAGDVPEGPLSPYAQSLHDRWRLGRDAVEMRRQEDIRACAEVDAVPFHSRLLDCIYRRDPRSLSTLYNSDEDIFGELAKVEMDHLLPALIEQIQQRLPAESQLVCPLGLGNHVDHQLVRAVADQIDRPISFYADVPYVWAWEAMIPDLLPLGAELVTHPISSAGLDAWTRANARYASQISSFWESEAEMAGLFADYSERFGGIRRWQVG